MTEVSTQKPSETSNANQAAAAGSQDKSILELVQTAARRTAKGLTRSLTNLNYNKLFSAVCADYKSRNGGGKMDRVPSEIADKISETINMFIETQISAAVNCSNAVSTRRSFSHQRRNLAVVEKVTVTGVNILPLQEQILGANIMLKACERRQKELEAKPTPDFDAEAKVKQQIIDLSLTKAHIEAALKAATVTPEKK